MRLLGLAGLMGACLATSPLLAADLFSSQPPAQAPSVGETELGSNWYIRGDVGYGETKQATIGSNSGLFPALGSQPSGNSTTPVSPVRGNERSIMNADYGIGFGYRVNDWLRAEADLGFSRGPGDLSVIVPCAKTTTTNTTCTGSVNTNQNNFTALAMAYVDLGHWGLFSPYIGGGAGLNVNKIKGSLTYTENDTGAVYSDPTQSGSAANWDRTLQATRYSFAAAAAAGLGIQISQSATLDVGYKFETLDITQGIKSLRQAVNVGVRYNLN